jgi:diacylglycerol O-acyltransferase / wax synthase
MAHERLSEEDHAFLSMESESQPQHFGSLSLLEEAPLLDDAGHFRINDLRAHIDARLHLVPRFRKRLMWVPFQQGRPVWVDDDRFDLTHHVRFTALPKPGTEAQLLTLFCRLQSHLLDRRRALWELWFVEGLRRNRVALIQKTHHCLVDGISGVDLTAVLFDLEPDHVVRAAPIPWYPDPAPTPQQLLQHSLMERATDPSELFRPARAALRRPRQAAERVADVARTVAATRRKVPTMPWNVPVSRDCRWAPARVRLERVKATKDAATAGGVTAGPCSVHDVILAACAGALRSFLQSRGLPPDDLVLKAVAPVSLRSEDKRGAVGSRVSMLPADLPVGEPDPRARLRTVHENLRELRESGGILGGDELMAMTSFLPPTILALASRAFARSPLNLTVTNVPGPQFPVYCMGARALEAFPYVGIAENMALTIAAVSYNGAIGFGLTGDKAALPDLPVLGDAIQQAFVELGAAVGAAPSGCRGGPRLN